MSTTSDPWFPLFEFQDWVYQSFLLLPTSGESAASPGTAVTARKWAQGDFLCGQAFKTSRGFELSGTLSLAKGIELSVSISGALGTAKSAATFIGTGTGTQGPTLGAVYALQGWVFPERPIQSNAARVLTVRGSVWAVRGPDRKPETELGGMPVDTVGAFVIARKV